MLGNLTDRALREPGFPVGHVIDFINTPWMMPAIYNVADMFIVTMMIGVALLVLVGLHLDGTRERRATAGATVDDSYGRRRRSDDDAAARRASADARRRRRPAPRRRTDVESRSLPVPDGLDGTRVDAALAKMLGFSRTFAADVVEAGGVSMDGRALAKSDKLRGGAWLDVSWAPKEEPRVVPVEVPDLGIVYDDDDIVVVDKPAGVAAHPSVGWEGPTVLGALAAGGYRIATTGAAERQGVVHRLDVGTSGLMVVAKTEHAYTALKRAFKEREVEKIYHAVVQGHPDPLAGTIDAPIGRHPTHSWKFAVTPDGKDSVTHYETLEAFPGASLLEIHLETGRTHQIRVHMAAHRHPCVGDPLYGADPTLSARLGLTRQWLHAHELSFAHPSSGDWVTFTSAYPADLAHALEVLRGE